MSINVDDTDSSIRYSGNWDVLIGSTRQWGAGTVHSTTQHGASATITFTGTRIVLYCTLFHGIGNEIADLNFDGKTTTVSKPSQSQDVFHDVWFDSGEILGVQHTLIISNGGGSSDTPLQIDQFFIEGVLDSPSAAPPPPPPPSPTASPNQAIQQKTTTTTQVTTALVTDNAGGAAKTSSSRSGSVSSSPTSSSNPLSPSSFGAPGSSSSSTTSSGTLSTALLTAAPTTVTGIGDTTVVSIQYIPTASVNGSSPDEVANSSKSGAIHSSRTVAVGGIVGGVIGALFLILSLLLLFFILRRRKKANQHILLADDAEKLNARPRNPTAVTPFPIDDSTPDHRPMVGSKLHSPPMANAQEITSTVSDTSSSGMYVASRTEKQSDFSSDTSHQFAPLTDVIPTQSNSPHRDTSHSFYAPYDHGQVTALHGSRPLSGETVVESALSPIHVSPPYADDALRPPSYHQNPSN